MVSSDWLTQDELLAELEQAGINLPERTLRFWVSHGVIPSPVKKPFRGADGRVGYYARETLTLVPQVLKLRDEGWKLRQIKARLEEPQKPERQPRANTTASQDSLELAQRYLADLMSDTEANDRRRCFSSPGAANSELRQVRHYLVARLERWFGRAVAVKATSSFLLGLDTRELRRLFIRLRINSSMRQAASTTETDIGPELLKAQLSHLNGEALSEFLEKLAPWTKSDSPSLLALRTQHCLEKIQRHLERTHPEQVEQLHQDLTDLASIEKQASDNLAFLEELSS